MPSLLALLVAGAFALEPPTPPVETPSNGVVGSVIGGLPSAAPVGSLPDEGVERGAPSLTAALGEAAHVVLAEVVDTHDVAGTPVEEAEVRLVLQGDPGVARVFYPVSSCGCGEPEKAKPGTPVLLLLAPGADVQQTRRFWQALDRIAKPSDFFDVVWSGSGRLVADADGLVETWLSLPASVPARRVGESSGRLVGKRAALDALVAWIQERAAEAEQPLP